MKKVYDQALSFGLVPKTVFSSPDAVATFGVGRNMVASIRHWGLACRVLVDTGDSFRLSKIAAEILDDSGLDPYADSPSSAWFAHWLLAGDGERSTTWYWLFNHVTASTFSRQDLEEPLARYAREVEPNRRVSRSTIVRDLDTCIRSYAPTGAAGSPEDFAEPLLAELGLLQEPRRGLYAFRRGPKVSLHDGIFAYALVDFWSRVAPTQSSLAFETIAYAEGSPGRVFKLDEESIAQRLIDLSSFTSRKLEWTDSAGLRQVHRKDLSKDDIETMIRRAYD